MGVRTRRGYGRDKLTLLTYFPYNTNVKCFVLSLYLHSLVACIMTYKYFSEIFMYVTARGRGYGRDTFFRHVTSPNLSPYKFPVIMFKAKLKHFFTKGPQVCCKKIIQSY